MREVAEEVFSVQGRDPLIDVAVELEKVARSDDFFVNRNLYPNVDFYSGEPVLPAVWPLVQGASNACMLAALACALLHVGWTAAVQLFRGHEHAHICRKMAVLVTNKA